MRTRNLLIVVLASLCITISGYTAISESVNRLMSSSLSSNIIVNGDFETGNLNGWSKWNDEFRIENSHFHTGLYSALSYTTSPYTASAIYQTLYPQTLLTVDDNIFLEAWVFPSKVGQIGGVESSAWMQLNFYNLTTGQQALSINYTWCSYVGQGMNGTSSLVYLLYSWNVSSWNLLYRDIRADTYPFLQGRNASDLVLYSVGAYYICWDGIWPGGYWVDDIDIVGTVEITNVQVIPTCPRPFVPSATPRIKEPVVIKANVSGTTPISGVILMFRRQNESWFNVTMVLNETRGLYIQTLPAQSQNCTVEFMIDARFSYCHVTSPLYNYTVKWLFPTDINGDGKVDIEDLARTSGDFAKHYP